MKKILYLVIFLCFFYKAPGQILSVAKSHDQKIVCTLKDSSCHVFKFDTTGNSVWGFKSSSSGQTSEWYQSVARTSDSGFVLGGYYYDSLTPAVGNYLLKINSVGDSLWSKLYQLQSGFYVVKETFDHGLILGSYPGVVLKTDSTGNPVWGFSFMPYMSGDNFIYDIKELQDSSYIICGHSFHHPPVNASYMILWKLDSQGNSQWIKEYSNGNATNVQLFNNEFLIGSLIYYGSHDSLCVFKTDSVGNVLWAKVLSYPVRIAKSTFNSIYCNDSTYLFYYSNALDSNSIIFKMDYQGNLIWQNEVMFQVGGIISISNGFLIAGWSQGHLEIALMDSMGNSPGCTAPANYTFHQFSLSMQTALGNAVTTSSPSIPIIVPIRYFTPDTLSSDLNCALINRIETQVAKEDILVFPNPSDNIIYLSGLHANEDYRLFVYAFSGEMVYMQSVTAESGIVKIAHSLPDGIYILTILNNNDYRSKTFFVSH